MGTTTPGKALSNNSYPQHVLRRGFSVLSSVMLAKDVDVEEKARDVCDSPLCTRDFRSIEEDAF